MMKVDKRVTSENCSKLIKSEMSHNNLSSVSCYQPSVNLEDRDLWTRFQVLTNEMIVTKSGRRMFPVVKATITGLDPSAMYSVLLEFVQIDNHRWKYVNGEWVPGGKPEAPPHTAVYLHTDSPNFGAHWMKDPVNFAKVKLTNKTNGSGQIMLNSLHKYEPRLHIVQVGSEQRTISAHAFPECQFIAVTAYQNEEVTALKIKHNPFAKAFLDSKERPDALAQRELLSGFPHGAHQSQYGWYMGGGAGMCGGGVAYGQATPPVALGPPSVSLASRLGVNMRNHRVVPYTSPNPRNTRTPPVCGSMQQQSISSYGIPGLTDWRQQAWSQHSNAVCNSSSTSAIAAHQPHYQWPLQSSYAHTGTAHGLYQGYGQHALSTTSANCVSSQAFHNQKATEGLSHMCAYGDPSFTHMFSVNRSSPSYDASSYGRLHGHSPDNSVTDTASHHSGDSPIQGHHHQAEVFILPDINPYQQTSMGGSEELKVKSEGLVDQLSTYPTNSPHPWSPLSPACM